jgi:F1F0 ATPase subunit 2
MTELPNLLLPLLAGCVLGAIFFGGLWWTLRLGLLSTWPAIWFLASYVLRTAISLAGFYLIGHNDWRRLLACLSGFVVARVLVTWLTRAPVPRRNQTSQGARI